MADEQETQETGLAAPQPSRTLQGMSLADKGVIIRDLDDAFRVSKWAFESRYLSEQIKNPQQALMVLMRGAELGLPPFASWRYIYQTQQGKLALESEGALAVCSSSPVFEDYEEHLEGEGDEILAVATATRRGRAPVRKTFSLADAKAAGLTDERKRDGTRYSGTWTKFTKDMLLARARSRALRIAFPDVLGGIPIQGEAEDIDRGTAERAQAKATPEPRVQPPSPAPAGGDPILRGLGVKAAPAPPIDVEATIVPPREDMEMGVPPSNIADEKGVDEALGDGPAPPPVEVNERGLEVLEKDEYGPVVVKKPKGGKKPSDNLF